MAKAGKYAHLTGNLPKLPAVEPERRSIVDMVKTDIVSAVSQYPTVVDSTESVADLLQEGTRMIRRLLDIEKRACAGRPYAAAFAQVYAELRTTKDCLNDWLSSVQLLLDAYEELMTGQMEQEGITSLRMMNGGSVSTYTEPYASVVNKTLFREWCLDHGFGDQLQLWPATMNAITKERLIAGEPVPDGVEVFAKTMVRLNKPK